MDEKRVFVGRQAELNRFREILEDPRGQAIVVAGQAGMGKTWLIDRMAELATRHPTLKCGWVRYEVTPTDSVDTTMALMMDNAFEAAQTCEGSFNKTDRRRAQWIALLKLLPKGGDIAELLASLRRDPQRHTREQFLERLRLISTRMGPNARALFVVDPEKTMCPGCADSWRLVTRELPDKVKFLFAQRPEDELVKSAGYMAQDNVVRLPGESLGVLAPEEVDDLVRLRADDVGQPVTALQEAMNKYKGHPYAIQAAMGIVKKTEQVDDLPQDPTTEAIAASQWQQVCRTGDDAIRLLEAHAILEVAVPQDIVQAVSGLDAVAMKRLLSDTYLRGLLRDEERGRRIYHAILADHVRGQIDPAQQKALHTQAILVYRASLKEAREQHKAPDGLAAVRLPEHIFATEESSVFVEVFVHECTVPLLNLGLLDVVRGLSERSLKFVEEGTKEKAAVLCNLAIVLQRRGDIDGAIALLKEQEQTCRQLQDMNGLQACLGNLAVNLHIRGDMDRAMAILQEQERICHQLRNLRDLPTCLGNQALILQDRGDLSGATALHKEEERLCRQLGDMEGLQRTLGNQALILQVRGDLKGALALFKEQEQICRQIGNLGGLQATLGNQAVVLQRRGETDEAMALLKEQERICHEIGDMQAFSVGLGNQALVLEERGCIDAAMALLRQQEQICRQLGDPEGLQRSLCNQAGILYSRGDLDTAMTLLGKQEQICRQLGNMEALHASLGIQALILKARGDIDGAMALLKEQERICRQLGNPEGLAISLGNQASILLQMGQAREALPLAEQAHQLAAKHGYAQLVRDFKPILNKARSAAQGG